MLYKRALVSGWGLQKAKREKEKRKERKSRAGLIGKVQTSHIPSRMGHSFCCLLLCSSWTSSLQKHCWGEKDRGKLAKTNKTPTISALIAKLLSLVRRVYSPSLTSPGSWSPVWAFLKVPAWLKSLNVVQQLKHKRVKTRGRAHPLWFYLLIEDVPGLPHPR